MGIGVLFYCVLIFLLSPTPIELSNSFLCSWGGSKVDKSLDLVFRKKMSR